MSTDKAKKSRKRRRDTELLGDDEEDGGVTSPVEVPPTPMSERKKKKKRKHSEVGGEDEDDNGADDGATPSRRKRKRRKMEWSSELDVELLTSALPLISKNTLGKRVKSAKSSDLEVSGVGGFTAEDCNERLHQLEAIVKPIKTRHQILNEALEMVKSRSTSYVNKMFSETYPKRPQSAYMIFCKDNRGAVQSESKPSEIMQQLAQKWKDLGDREKGKYVKKAAVEASKHDSEMVRFKEAHPDLYLPKKLPGKAKKTQVGPSPPARSALLLFKNDYSSRHGDSSDTREACSKAWKELPVNTKATWNEKWRAMVVTYRADLTKLRQSASAEDQAVIDELLEKHTIAKTVKQVGYDLFAKTKRAELRAFHPKDSLKEINDKLKVQWTTLPDLDRQRYCQQAKLLQDV